MDTCVTSSTMHFFWNTRYLESNTFLKQVDKAIDIFQRKYPNHIIFMFDNAPCHKNTADDALNVEHMNVKPGGKQPRMRDTVWNGHVQPMVFPVDNPKVYTHFV